MKRRWSVAHCMMGMAWWVDRPFAVSQFAKSRPDLYFMQTRSVRNNVAYSWKSDQTIKPDSADQIWNKILWLHCVFVAQNVFRNIFECTVYLKKGGNLWPVCHLEKIWAKSQRILSNLNTAPPSRWSVWCSIASRSVIAGFGVSVLWVCVFVPLCRGWVQLLLLMLCWLL